MKTVGIDNLFAAWVLTEFLYENKLINEKTIEAIRSKITEAISKQKPNT